MTEINSIDQLEHQKSNLSRCDSVFVGRKETFKILFCKFKDQMKFFFIRSVNDVFEAELLILYLTILG